jgi:hypothetical protein
LAFAGAQVCDILKRSDIRSRLDALFLTTPLVRQTRGDPRTNSWKINPWTGTVAAVEIGTKNVSDFPGLFQWIRKQMPAKKNCSRKDKVRMKTIVIKLHAGSSGLTDDKDEARKIRKDKILPALESGDPIVIDFTDVQSSTQSFVHALLGEVLHRFRNKALLNLEFRHCSPLMKSLVELVVDYSLGGFEKATKKKSENPSQKS